MSHRVKRYTSDLSDQAWAIIQAWLPLSQSGAGRPIEIDLRQAVNARLYLLKTGCQWATLPGEFPPYQSVYYHYHKWCHTGVWERVNRALLYQSRRAAGRRPDPSAGVMDSQSVKTTGVGGLRGYDAGKKVKGRKRHSLVDRLGYRWKGVVQAADLQDREGAKRLLERLPPMLRLRLLKLWADGGYRGTLVEWCWQQMQTGLERVSPPPTQQGFAVLPKRWLVERTFAWLGNSRRLSKDYEEGIPSSEGMIYLASIHFLLKRLTA